MAVMLREEYQFTEVVSKTCFVGFKTFLAAIFASVIHGNANRSGKVNSKSNGFDFSKSESFTESWSVAVSDGLAVNGRSESI
jgi:hypothetical protein